MTNLSKMSDSKQSLLEIFKVLSVTEQGGVNMVPRTADLNHDLCNSAQLP